MATTKRKATKLHVCDSNTGCSKPDHPVSKKKNGLPITVTGTKFPENWGKIKVGDKHVDFDKAWEEMEIPTRKELGMHRGNEMSLPNKITLVLTVVNVIILISLVIKNV